jgi:hypothetical protein
VLRYSLRTEGLNSSTVDYGTMPSSNRCTSRESGWNKRDGKTRVFSKENVQLDPALSWSASIPRKAKRE